MRARPAAELSHSWNAGDYVCMRVCIQDEVGMVVY
jgi:hypothetical protein